MGKPASYSICLDGSLRGKMTISCITRFLLSCSKLFRSIKSPKPFTCSLRTAQACTPTSPGSVGSVVILMLHSPQHQNHPGGVPVLPRADPQEASDGHRDLYLLQQLSSQQLVFPLRLKARHQQREDVTGPFEKHPTRQTCSHPPSNEYKENYEELLSSSESHVFSVVITGQLFLSFSS